MCRLLEKACALSRHTDQGGGVTWRMRPASGRISFTRIGWRAAAGD